MRNITMQKRRMTPWSTFIILFVNTVSDNFWHRRTPSYSNTLTLTTVDKRWESGRIGRWEDGRVSRGEEIRREVERGEGGGLEMRDNKTCTNVQSVCRCGA
jgi:hypothetical protein